MAKISENGGVTDVNVHPDYVAPAGVPVEQALDLGLPDQGAPADEEQSERDEKPDERTQDEKQDEKSAKKATPAKAAAPATPDKKTSIR